MAKSSFVNCLKAISVTICVGKTCQDSQSPNSKQSVHKSLDRICGDSINKYKNIKKTTCVSNYPPLGVPILLYFFRVLTDKIIHQRLKGMKPIMFADLSKCKR